MKTKAYQDLFLAFKKQEAKDEQRLAGMKELCIMEFYHLPEDKREVEVAKKTFPLTISLKKKRINEMQSKIKKLEKNTIGR